MHAEKIAALENLVKQCDEARIAWGGDVGAMADASAHELYRYVQDWVRDVETISWIETRLVELKAMTQSIQGKGRGEVTASDVAYIQDLVYRANFIANASSLLLAGASVALGLNLADNPSTSLLEQIRAYRIWLEAQPDLAVLHSEMHDGSIN